MIINALSVFDYTTPNKNIYF